MKCYNGGEVIKLRNNNPPFEVTSAIIDAVAEIAELVGRMNAAPGVTASPNLRRVNRIRTVYSSLAIEQNTLTLDQVTAVLDGRRVLAPPRDIAEVKNAYAAYEMLAELDPYSVDALLTAHGVMMRGLLDEAGCFRSCPVGVADSEGNILHFGSLPAYVPGLVAQLLDWVRNADYPMLIKSCVFHYELELIHPFADGNGRVGRLWHTLLLAQWKPLFAWLPVESIIHDRQRDYYRAINRANDEASSTAFIEFMLAAIKDALLDAAQAADADALTTEARREHGVIRFIEKNSVIFNADVRQLFAVSPATANRILAKLAADGKIKKVRVAKSWGYVLPDDR